jgi:hypothetical protein
MASLIALLGKIEMRPRMYIKDLDINLLQSFINGYFVCESLNNIVPDEDNTFKDNFWSWVREKYNLEPSLDWSDMIEQITKEKKQKNSIKVFFEEFNHFKKENLENKIY